MYEEQFFIVDKKSLECVRRCLVENKKVPEHIVYHNSKYYLLYVRKVGLFQDCIAGNVMWVGNYNRNMERRRLREVNANVVLQEEPAIEIINSEDEWCYWYHNLIIGKLYKVIEMCIRDRQYCSRNPCDRSRIFRNGNRNPFIDLCCMDLWQGSSGMLPLDRQSL